MNEKTEKIDEGIKELVIARLGIMPVGYKLSIGNDGTFTRNELIAQVKNDTMIGNQIAKMQLNFIKALTSGKLMDTLNKNG